MLITRRAALATTGAMLFTPMISRAASAGSRSFSIIRDGDDMGFQRNKVTLVGDTIAHEVEVEIKVKVLGITVYRYELDYVEEWKAGQLQSLDAKCNDDGEAHFAKAKRAGDVIEINGSGYNGTTGVDAATTSYWAYPFVSRSTWISTQTGDPMKMTAKPAGSETIETQNGPVTAQKYSCAGGYIVDVFYIDQEWVGVKFDAGGEIAAYLADNTGPQFMPVWNAA